MHFFLDFIIILGVAFVLYVVLNFFGAPLWLTLGILVTWGAITGYKPSLFRKPFGFLYKKEDKSR